jgi:hypothetical protein
MGLAEFWKLSDDETEYFLELVNLARASHPALLRRSRERLERLSRSAETERKESGATSRAVAESGVYYSSWHWSAVHILVSIPRYATVDAIAQALGLERGLVQHTLSGLGAQGLVEQHDGKWRCLPTHLHLPADSPFSAMNHANWRSRAVLDAQLPGARGLHYTGVQSHSRAALQSVRARLLETIEDTRRTFSSSPEETLSCVTVDFFEVVN